MIEQAPRRIWDALTIDFQRRRVFADELEVHLRGQSTFWMLAHIADSNHPLTYAELNPLAIRLEAAAPYPASLIIHYLRTFFKDDQGRTLITGNATEGFSIGAAKVSYVGYIPIGEEPDYFGWQRMNGEITKSLLPRKPVTVEEAGARVNLNNRTVHLTGLERELIMTVPSTGRHFISREDLSWILYGNRDQADRLKGLVHNVNLRRLRPFTEIVGIPGKRIGVGNVRVVGYYHNGLVKETPPPREKPEWRVGRINII